MSTKVLRRCLVTMAIGTMAVAGFSAPATAAPTGDHTSQPRTAAAGPPPGAACSTDGWVHACYVPKGDVIWVKDTRADGYHADVHFWWGGQGWEPSQTCHNRLGADAGWTYCNGFADMIPEHEGITLWPMESDADEDIVPGSGGSQIHSSTT